MLLSRLKPDYRQRTGVDERPLLQRMFLHAERVRFLDIDGVEVDVTAPLPEDLTVALLLSRLVAGLGRPWVAVVVVAALFAAGHVPTMLERGAGTTELAWLLRDVGLGVLVLSAVVRGRDILWFVPVHFAMDMTQFDRITGA